MAYIGIDLHTNKFNICYLTNDNQTLRKTFTIIDEQLEEFTSLLSLNDYIVVEASTNTFSFSDLIKDKVKKVFSEHVIGGRIVEDFALALGSERIS